MAELSYVNVFANDIETLSRFYIDLFGFEEIPEIRSPIFRGVRTGRSAIGFNAFDAYALLGLGDRLRNDGVGFLLNFDLDSTGDVDRLVPIAIDMGAVLIKPAYRTYYDWYQAVLLDPERNVFRINTVL